MARRRKWEIERDKALEAEQPKRKKYARKKNIHYEVGLANTHLGVFINNILVGNVVVSKKQGTTTVDRYQYVEVGGKRVRSGATLFAKCEDCLDYLEENCL